MAKIISCDWGTSTFRIRIVDTVRMTVLAEQRSGHGVSRIFELWHETRKEEHSRLSFYLAYLKEQIKNLENELSFPLKSLPLIISGMASSGIGMMELPYKYLPVSVTGDDLNLKMIDQTDEFSHPIMLISGVRTKDDVMRGEETQLVGCMIVNDENEGLFVFPGTHSKHVQVKDGMVMNITTYMTGEFFALLSNKSILSGAVEQIETLSDWANSKNFENGVSDSVNSNLLHTAFLVRTRHILDKMTKEENYCYLSGLVIGTEVQEIAGTGRHIILISNEPLFKYYSSAFQILGRENIENRDADNALIKGHCKIFELKMSKLLS